MSRKVTKERIVSIDEEIASLDQSLRNFFNKPNPLRDDRLENAIKFLDFVSGKPITDITGSEHKITLEKPLLLERLQIMNDVINNLDQSSVVNSGLEMLFRSWKAQDELKNEGKIVLAQWEESGTNSDKQQTIYSAALSDIRSFFMDQAPLI